MKFWRVVLPLLTLLWCGLSFAETPPPCDIVVQHDLVFRTVEGQKLALDVLRPAGVTDALPTVLVVHGGAWITGERAEMRPLTDMLAGWGFAVVNIDYRLAPRWTFPAPLDDVRAAAEWMRAHAKDYGFDLTRCYIAGASAGGQLAALLALKPDTTPVRFNGMVLMATPADLTVKIDHPGIQYLLQVYLGAKPGGEPDVYAAASPITYVTAGAPPALLIHGEADEQVPVDQSKRLADALRAKKVPVTLVLLPNAIHEIPAEKSAAGIIVREALWTFISPALKHPADAPAK